MELAARNGHTNIVDVIASTDKNAIDAYTCHMAAVGGHLDLVRHICATGVVPINETLRSAVYAGHMAVVRYLVEHHNLQFHSHQLWCAIRTGNVDLVRYLCERFDFKGSLLDLCTAAHRGQRNIVAYLLGRGVIADDWTIKVIVKRNWTDVVSLLCALDSRAADHIAVQSIDQARILCLECALVCGATLDLDLMTRAAERGNLAMIDLLVAHGLKWSVDAMRGAASNGRIETLSCARTAGIPFDVEACALAAGNGHAETVRYLCNRKCPVDGRARARAKARGHHDIERYLADRGCTWDEDEYRARLASSPVSRYCPHRYC
jgi:hypothetical protein